MKQLYSQLVIDYSENIDVMDNSRKLYVRILNTFSVWVVRTGRDIKTLKRADIIAYKSYLIADNKSENTIDSYLTVVRCFFEYLESIGEHDNIAAGIRVKHKNTGYKKTHLSISEIAILFTAVDRSTLIGKRDFAIINLMLRSGIRCVEISRLRVCDIDVSDTQCSITLQRKGSSSRSERLGLTIKALQPIKDYILYRGVECQDEPLFLTHCSTKDIGLSAGTVGRIVTGYLKRSGIYTKQKTAHSLRHTAAVQAILNKIPIKEVQLMLGHRRVETTEIYLKSIDDEIRLDNPAVRALDDAF